MRFAVGQSFAQRGYDAGGGFGQEIFVGEPGAGFFGLLFELLKLFGELLLERPRLRLGKLQEQIEVLGVFRRLPLRRLAGGGRQTHAGELGEDCRALFGDGQHLGVCGIDLAGDLFPGRDAHLGAQVARGGGQALQDGNAPLGVGVGVCAVGLRIGGDGDQQRLRFINVEVWDGESDKMEDMKKSANAAAAQETRRPRRKSSMAERWADESKGFVLLNPDGTARDPNEQAALDRNRAMLRKLGFGK